jgi:hypothetical protein
MRESPIRYSEKSSPWVAVFVFSEVGVLDEHLSELSPLSDVAVHARQGWNRAQILCSLAGRYGYSAERA